MKNSVSVLRIFAAILLILSIMSSCKKEEKPSVLGTWETIQAFGYAYEYEFKEDGQTCRRLPEVFGTTAFCYGYEFDRNDGTMVTYANRVEKWEWEFVCEDVAKVKVLIDSSDVVQYYILNRIK